jgi:hypothetical protein
MFCFNPERSEGTLQLQFSEASRELIIAELLRLPKIAEIEKPGISLKNTKLDADRKRQGSLPSARDRLLRSADEI